MQRGQGSGRSALAAAALLSSLFAATACVSSPEPQETARSTLQTAPADLQLLCANAVATQTGAAADKVLPTSSRQLDARSFQVDIDASGSRHSCVVDVDGNIMSVS